MSVVLSGIVVLVTHAVEAVTGFGCTVLALPFVTALLGMKTGVVVLATLAWILAVYIAVTKRRFIVLREFAIIAAFVGLGLPVGMYLFRNLDTTMLKKALAGFIILVSAYQLLRAWRPRTDRRSLPRPIYFLLLVLGGIVHGAFASGGPLVVVYASRALRDKSAFRATLCLLWATLNTVLMISYIAGGIYTPGNLSVIGMMLPFLGTGIVAGEFVHDRIDAELFKKIVFAVLLLTGIIMAAA